MTSRSVTPGLAQDLEVMGRCRLVDAVVQRAALQRGAGVVEPPQDLEADRIVDRAQHVLHRPDGMRCTGSATSTSSVIRCVLCHSGLMFVEPSVHLDRVRCPSNLLDRRWHRAWWQPTLDRPITETQRWAYPLLLVLSGVALGVSGLPAPLYGIYEANWHLSPLSTTIVFAVYALAALAAVLVSGRISDVVGRKPVLLGALVALLVGLGVFLVADNMAMLLLARTIHGAAVGSIVVAGAAALLDLRPDHGVRAGQLSGVSFNIGMTVAIIGSALLAQYAPHPLRTPYAVVAVVCLVVGVGTGGAARTAHDPHPRPDPDRQTRRPAGDPRRLLVLRARRDGVLVGARRAAVAVPVAGGAPDPHRQPGLRRRCRRRHGLRRRTRATRGHPGAGAVLGDHRRRRHGGRRCC